MCVTDFGMDVSVTEQPSWPSTLLFIVEAVGRWRDEDGQAPSTPPSQLCVIPISECIILVIFKIIIIYYKINLIDMRILY